MITVFSFIMAFFWSSLMILIVSFLRNSLKITLKIDTVLLVSLYIACMIRFFIPFEFGFVKEIELTSFYTKFYTVIREIFFENFLYINLIDLSVFIVLSVAFIKLVLFFKTYKKETSFYMRSGTKANDMEFEILNNIQDNTKTKIKMNILYSNFIQSPITFGIFKKIILLPTVSLTEQELHYIILHEYMHHLNKDLLIKMLTSIFCIIFWWNPFVYLLNKNLDETLELKCDLSITSKLSNLEKAYYLEIIKKFVNNEFSSSKKSNSLVSFGMVRNTVQSVTDERFRAVSQFYKSKNKNKILSAITLIIFVCTFVLSYMFIVQPAYIPSEENLDIKESTVVFKSEDTSYIINNYDGSYTIYFNDGTTYTITNYDVVLQMIESSGFVLIEE